MNKIDIIYNNYTYSFIMDKYKILYGNNFRDKYNIIKCFRQYFNKGQYSEYSIENINRTTIKLDEKNIDLKNTFFYELSYGYDLNNDEKLSTKSLILKYLEIYLEQIEYEDEFITIKNLLEEFINITLKDIVNLNMNNIKLELKLGELNYKTIIKLLEPIFLKESLEVNNYDLSYDDIYIIQLQILDKLALKLDKNVIVIADIPLLTDEITKAINALANIKLIICSNTYNSSISIENYLLIDFNFLDLNDDEKINDFVMNLPYHSNISQIKSTIKESLLNFELKHLIYNKKS